MSSHLPPTVFGIAALIAACSGLSSTVTNPTADGGTRIAARVALGQEFPLENGQAALVGSEGLTIRFERVRSDERCPVGDTCSSPGDAVLVVAAHQPPEAPATLELHTDSERNVDAKYLSYRVSVIRLEPRPVGEQPVPLPRYVATLKVLN